MNNKTIRINGYALSGALSIDDPEHGKMILGKCIKCISTPRQMKIYINKHPEGVIILGYGVSFFDEPVPVSRNQIAFDKEGNVDIIIRDGAEKIVKQIRFTDEIAEEAHKELWGKSSTIIS